MSKFNIGDKVRVKSLEWYNSNKDEVGHIKLHDGISFNSAMANLCGKVMTVAVVISYNRIAMKDCCWVFSDDMLEDEVVESCKSNVKKLNIMSKFKVGDTVKVKSKEWYEANKDTWGDVGDVSNGVRNTLLFILEMAPLLGQIVKIKGINDDGDYYIENSEYRLADYMLEDYVLGTDNPKETVLKELIPDNKNNIDWEQRRYELAKAAMQANIGLEQNSFTKGEDLVTCSINLADEMIRQLKNS